MSNIYYIYNMGKLERPHCGLTGLKVSKGNRPQDSLISG